jgi:deoxyribonuclease V
MKTLHPWNLSPEEAACVQAELRQKLSRSWGGGAIETVGGVDVSIRENQAQAAIVVLRYPSLSPLKSVIAEAPLVFPYIPGLLAFREGPAVLAAWEKLVIWPDLLLFDGQGIAHPRGIGIAAQMGLWLERPTIGVAKSRLYGRHAEVGAAGGDRTPLHDEKDRSSVIGAVLRTREKTNPLYISPGHLIDVEHAVEFVLQCTTGHRLPEPTRWAHKVAGGERLPVAEPEQTRLF